ncbi:hypothetical protein HCZ30_03840 [Marivivens donghaensis]|uniref:Uncharacterized protein n=1 Tax=Marivivens donghaensis TaxID=1699413 RepID=A0ABX0VY38_9RHOB|nr:hypothetical protein [Marivivens donghaensis]NIY71562.1 hypothetical protein [Marivivens donghaensis]
MRNALIAGLVAAALSLANPAAAQTANSHNNDDIGKLIVGLTFLALVGTALSKKDDTPPAPEAVENDDHRDWERRNDYTRHNDRDNNGRWDNHGENNGRWNDNHPSELTRALPAQCLQGVPTYNGPVSIYTSECLQQNRVQITRLPGNCARQVRGVRDEHYGFDPDCLSSYGFNMLRR